MTVTTRKPHLEVVFDGIDRTTCASIRGMEPSPLTIELIKAGFARMMARRPPPPMLPYLTETAGEILWSRHSREVRDLVVRGVRGQEMIRQLALTTTMSYEIASAFVVFIESCRARPSIADIECEIATERPRQDTAPRGMVRPRHQRVKPAPPVPPWARERKRRQAL